MAEEVIAETQESLLTGKDSTDPGQQVAADQTAVDASTDNTAEAEVQTGAPETYEPFAMPEGLELNEEIFVEFQTLAKEHNLSQEDAQKYADFGVKIAQQAQEGTVEQLSEQWQGTLAKWVGEIKADKELGGDNLPETLSVARKAIATFGSDALKQTLEETGMTNNPELLRVFYRIGKALSDDSFHSGNAAAGQKSLGDVLYPTMQ